jgi:DNA-binding CsgD family transcriptional regulator
MNAAANSDGRLVVIEGVAGIGKTRLLAEARALAGARGLEVLHARGGEHEGEFALGIVRQLFEPALAACGADARRELLSGAAELAAPVFSASVAEGAVETSFALLHGLYWLAANIAARTPVVVIVDDAHWADDSSLRWLVYAARRLESVPILLIAATRPSEQARNPLLLNELIGDPLAAVVRPQPLGLASAATMTRAAVDADPDDAFTEALEQASNGIPLYLRALLETVREQRIEPSADQAPRVLELGPKAVSRSVETRLAGLPEAAVALARASAVLGDAGELRHAAALAELDAAGAAEAATALVRSGLLDREDPPQFAHPVIRTAVYQSIGAAERFRSHRRAAELLLVAGAYPEQAASHLLSIIPAGDPFVVATLREAAARALAQGAPEAAITYLRRALQEPPDELRGVLWELARAERLIDSDAAVEHYEEALAFARGPEEHGKLALEYGQALWLATRPDESIGILRDAIARLPEESDTRAWLVADLIGAAWWYPDLYPIAVEQLATVRADRLQSGPGAEALLAILAESEMRSGRDHERAIAFAHDALASGRLAQEREFGFFSAAVPLLFAGEVGTVAAATGTGLVAARRSGDVFATAALLALRSLTALQQGDLGSAEQDASEALELARLHDSTAVIPLAAYLLAEVAMERGRLGDANAALAAAEVMVLPDSPRGDRYLVFVFYARGKQHLFERKPAQALTDFLASGRVLDSVGIFNPADLPWRSQVALALDALDRRDEAREFAREELSLSRAWGVPRTLGISLRALGLVEGGDEGDRLLRDAVDVLADSPARLEHARALVDLGSAFRRANSRSEARRHLREGIQLAHVCGATALVDRANDELAATGAHRRTILLTGLDALTASERRVAQMAADGASNKEIAQALFVTVKTVEMHLGRVYRKLEITSRSQLAGVLGRSAVQGRAPA